VVQDEPASRVSGAGDPLNAAAVFLRRRK